mgnify:CR=1 FL=1
MLPGCGIGYAYCVTSPMFQQQAHVGPAGHGDAASPLSDPVCRQFRLLRRAGTSQ